MKKNLFSLIGAVFMMYPHSTQSISAQPNFNIVFKF